MWSIQPLSPSNIKFSIRQTTCNSAWQFEDLLISYTCLQKPHHQEIYWCSKKKRQLPAGRNLTWRLVQLSASHHRAAAGILPTSTDRCRQRTTFKHHCGKYMPRGPEFCQSGDFSRQKWALKTCTFDWTVQISWDKEENKYFTQVFEYPTSNLLSLTNCHGLHKS